MNDNPLPDPRQRPDSRQILQPEGWARPRGYANGVAATGRVVTVAGQIGWDGDCQFTATDLAGQTRQALTNVIDVLACADAGPQHVVRMTWYLVDRADYLARGREIGAIYRELMRGPDGAVCYPAMTAVQVVALMEAQALVEIEVTAVV
ncbi:MAG: RidA family protein [Burkholderiaceae bacterium]